MQHMDEGLLQAWLDGPRAGLDEEERAAVEAHLAGCPRCAARAEALRESSGAAADLLAAGSGVEAEEIPPFDAVVARAREMEGQPPRLRGWVTTGWAASVLIAVGAGWLANEITRGTPEQAGPSGGERVEQVASAEEAGAADGSGAQPAGAVADAEGARTEQPPSEPARGRLASERVAVSGRVTDAGSGRPLEAAQVFVPGTGVGTLTNPDGRFLLFVDPRADSVGDVTVSVQRIGYGEERRALTLADRDTVVTDFRMSPTALALEELVVTGVGEDRAPQAEAPAAASPETDGGAMWRAVSEAEAEAFLGFPVRTVPGLEVAAVEAGTVEGVRVVRVAHALADGGRLMLLQARRPVAFPEDAPAGFATARLDGEISVAARGPLPADSIRALLGRIR